MKKWLIFVVVIAIALSYGFFIREKSPPIKAVADKKLIEKPIYSHSENNQAKLIKREVVLMGSQFTFVVDAPRKQALNAITQITKNLVELESKISSWKPGSDIFLLNQKASNNSNSWVKISPLTMDLLVLSKQVYKETEADFDISIGPVWDLYPFRDPSAVMPTDKQILQQLQFVSTDKIQLNTAELKAKLAPGMKINLGGIGKGYAAHIGIKLMKSMGIKNAAISAGGDVYLMGKKTTGPWQVSIENPRWPGQSIEQFSIADSSVATSGDSKRFFTHKGKRYSHIINPKTGTPVTHAQSVSIITKNATLADAYATAVFVKGTNKGLQWVNNKEGIEALIIDHNGTVFRSNGWNEITKDMQK